MNPFIGAPLRLLLGSTCLELTDPDYISTDQLFWNSACDTFKVLKFVKQAFWNTPMVEGKQRQTRAEQDRMLYDDNRR